MSKKKSKTKAKRWPLGFAPPGPRTQPLPKPKRRGPVTSVSGHSIDVRPPEDGYDL